MREDWEMMKKKGRLKRIVGVYEKELKIKKIEKEKIVMSVDEIKESKVEDIKKII